MSEKILVNIISIIIALCIALFSVYILKIQLFDNSPKIEIKTIGKNLIVNEESQYQIKHYEVLPNQAISAAKLSAAILIKDARFKDIKIYFTNYEDAYKNYENTKDLWTLIPVYTDEKELNLTDYNELKGYIDLQKMNQKIYVKSDIPPQTVKSRVPKENISIDIRLHFKTERTSRDIAIMVIALATVFGTVFSVSLPLTKNIILPSIKKGLLILLKFIENK